MHALLPTFALTAIGLIVIGCADTRHATPLVSFVGVRPYSEEVVVEVKRGAQRQQVESALIADGVGADELAKLYASVFTFQRLKHLDELEEVLTNFFDDGDESVRTLWRRYPEATFIGLESDNYTIVFFDENDLAVAAWPTLSYKQMQNKRLQRTARNAKLESTSLARGL